MTLVLPCIGALFAGLIISKKTFILHFIKGPWFLFDEELKMLVGW
jgi:hypothetical protein